MRTAEYRARAEGAYALRGADGCQACPRECGRVDGSGKSGSCGRADHAVIAYAAPYFAEEPCLVGDGGTGAIFFAGCNLRCATCRNEEISHQTDAWREVDPEELASFMLSLQARGVENLNLITPSHVVPEILDALGIAADRGLDLPVVFNTSTYDRVEMLRHLDGVVDVYLPDVKFTDPAVARRMTHAEDYPEVALAAVREMHRQVGDLVLDDRGLVVRGLLVRHLILPGDMGGTAELVRFLAEEVSTNTCLNLMGSYVPPPKLVGVEPFNRRPTREEVLEAELLARAAGLRVLGNTSIG